MSRSRFVGVLALTTPAVLLLGGCVETQSPSTDTETAVDMAAPDSSHSPAADTAVPEETLLDTPPEQCTTNPMASDFAPFLEQEKIPTGMLGEDGPGGIVPTPDSFYHFQIGENGYDSCSGLSYLVLNGSNGDAERSAGIGAAIADAVVLFNDGEMISSPAPFQMKTVEEVTRIADNQIEVVYGHAGRSTAEGVTEHHTFTFIHTADGLTGAGSLPPGIDNHARLDLR